MAAQRLDIRRERDAAGNVVRIVVRAGAGQVIDEVVWIRGPKKWRCAIGLVKANPQRRTNGVRDAVRAH
jgi:hypothetical protein